MAQRAGHKRPRKAAARVSPVVARQRAVQLQVARADRAHPHKVPKRAMQAGARRYPELPLPRQHERKPGSESALEPAPMFDAPYYLGSGKSAGKIALITGGDSGIGRAVEAEGRLDVLVNNAAFQVHAPRLEALAEEHFDLTLKSNLYGYFFMPQVDVPHLGAGSAIVNNGSVTGILGSGHRLDYAMTKGGIHAFTKSLAAHLMPRGIRVNAVAP